MSFTGTQVIAAANEKEISVAPLHDLGARMQTKDGRGFRYAKAGSVALVAGDLQQGPAPVADHLDRTTTVAHAIGATSIAIPLGATAATANQYAGGYMVVNDDTGEGLIYSILTHPAAALSTTLTVTLREPLKVALDTTTEVGLIANPYKGTIVFPTTATSMAVGVATAAVTALYYYWAQVYGICSVLNDGNLTVSSAVSPSNGTAGAVENGVIAQGFVGHAVQTGVTTDRTAVFLNIS